MTTDPKLRSSNPIILLGAGASADAGIPTSTELTLRILKHFKDSDLFAPINYVVAELVRENARKGLSIEHGVDCERLFSALEFLAKRDTSEAAMFTGVWSREVELIDRGAPAITPAGESLIEKIVEVGSGFGKHGHEASFAQENLKRLFVEAVERQVTQSRSSEFQRAAKAIQNDLPRLLRVPNADTGLDYLSPLVCYSERVPQLTIATLNYDDAIELACNKTSISYSTGIDTWQQRRPFNFDGMKVALLKLHGSVDWTYHIVPRSSRTPLRSKVVGACVAGKRNREPAIIFGQGNKLTAKGPFLRLFRVFQERLERSKHMVIIGYSFRDEHINEIITQWMNADERRTLTVVSRSRFESPDQEFARELLELRRSKRCWHLMGSTKDVLAESEWWKPDPATIGSN